MTGTQKGAYTADHSLVDYILGITYEIWEEGGVDLIDQYYAADTVVYCLDSVTDNSAVVIYGTNAMLAAFPDRLLLADDIIGKGDSQSGYSSHRVLSPMTNTGDSSWGPATGKQVRIVNMADCVVEDGVIVREWLARDNLALVRQLGFDVRECAELVASRRNDALQQWFDEETQRLGSASLSANVVCGVDMQELLHALWISGDESVLDVAYPHYAVMHRSPVETISGGAAIAGHYQRLRDAFRMTAATVDHVCVQSAGDDADHVAIRWSVCGTHHGDYLGIKASGKPVYIMGITHRRMVSERIAIEWTVFDSLAVMAQLL